MFDVLLRPCITDLTEEKCMHHAIGISEGKRLFVCYCCRYEDIEMDVT
jgi:hypothetical protein